MPWGLTSLRQPSAHCRNPSAYFKAYILAARETLFQRNLFLCLTPVPACSRKLGDRSDFAYILLQFPANFHTHTVNFSSAIKYGRKAFRSSQKGSIFPAQVNFAWHFLSLLFSVPRQPIPLQGSAWASACGCRLTALSLQQELSVLGTFPNTWLGKLAGEPEPWVKEQIQGVSSNLLVLTPGGKAHAKEENGLLKDLSQRGSAPSWPFCPALCFSYLLSFSLLWNYSDFSCSGSTSIPVGQELQWR